MIDFWDFNEIFRKTEEKNGKVRACPAPEQ
jgi:hypothetical protein